ncbi:MAG: hypothetical protein E6G67_00335, partial [Actinobacteria bacterium]
MTEATLPRYERVLADQVGTSRYAAKRCLDLVLTAGLLLVLLPALLVIGLLVRVGTEGPVLYRQERVGARRRRRDGGSV